VFTSRSVGPEKVQQKEKHMILNGPEKKVNYSKTFFFHFSLLKVTVHTGYKNLEQSRWHIVGLLKKILSFESSKPSQHI